MAQIGGHLRYFWPQALYRQENGCVCLHQHRGSAHARACAGPFATWHFAKSIRRPPVSPAILPPPPDAICQPGRQSLTQASRKALPAPARRRQHPPAQPPAATAHQPSHPPGPASQSPAQPLGAVSWPCPLRPASCCPSQPSTATQASQVQPPVKHSCHPCGSASPAQPPNPASQPASRPASRPSPQSSHMPGSASHPVSFQFSAAALPLLPHLFFHPAAAVNHWRHQRGLLWHLR
ncbi:uncharacterized protein PSFLO_02274 [Pseudozyma flocculosa]|uniref:Uncharacterized protein n=1 Tax=Pseudozyma flocculosa TaxID=84751 RepID=A0A5C3EWZ7_9BASI|nr:uncharacterized protein PSFLO_02274 [Pseudozyma flocculosa]